MKIDILSGVILRLWLGSAANCITLAVVYNSALDDGFKKTKNKAGGLRRGLILDYRTSGLTQDEAEQAERICDSQGEQGQS